MPAQAFRHDDDTDDLFFEPVPVVTAQLGRGLVWRDMLAQMEHGRAEEEPDRTDRAA